MGRPKSDNPRRVRNTRFSDRAVVWMQRQAKANKKKSWRIWLQDDIEERAAADGNK